MFQTMIILRISDQQLSKQFKFSPLALACLACGASVALGGLSVFKILPSCSKIIGGVSCISGDTNNTFNNIFPETSVPVQHSDCEDQLELLQATVNNFLTIKTVTDCEYRIQHQLERENRFLKRNYIPQILKVIQLQLQTR